MKNTVVKVRIIRLLRVNKVRSRQQLQTSLNGDTHVSDDISRTGLINCINEMIKDKRLERIGKGSKIKYKLHEEAELKVSELWKTPDISKLIKPDLKKIWSDFRKKIPVMRGCVCGGLKK